MCEHLKMQNFIIGSGKFSTNSGKVYDFNLCKNIDDQVLVVNPKDAVVSQSIINTGKWEQDIRDIFLRYIKPGMKVMDIGAYIGTHTLLLSKLVGNEGTVYSVEPNIEFCKMINTSINLNKINNVKIINMAISDRSESQYILNQYVNFDELRDYSMCSTFSPANQDSIEVPANSVDFMNFDLDCIKIDVNGSEDKVLLGMKSTIQKYKPILIVEIYNFNREKVIPIIKKFKYVICRIPETNHYLCASKI